MAQHIEFVLVLGLQRYSQGLFKEAEAEVRKAVPNFRLHVFEDRDVERRPAELEAAIARCACLIASLLPLAETAEWLVPTVERPDPPVVFAVENPPGNMR
ncbi:MAG TPA: DUF3479 domain-containing protein, partial [Chloroflexaceae bacterium]|nr:DUF3479 domain-containing protein [Chloroflexaceae bacterium]